VWTWGQNSNGQLGDNTLTNRMTAVPVEVRTGNADRPVKGLGNVVAIAGGGSHALALRNDGTVWSWGHDGSGQLGRPATDSCSGAPCAPAAGQVQLPSGVRAVAIAAGSSHGVVLTSSGAVFAFGSNSHGQLGLPTTTAQSQTPVAVTFSAL